MKKTLIWLLTFTISLTYAQTNSYEFTTTQHNKEIIGYFTQWDAWKNSNHGVEKGFYSQLNLDYSQYTILNWSFFGVANDGSLHSADYRNSQINVEGVEQEPAPLFHTDSYSSWDNWLFYGEMEVLYYLPDNLDETPEHSLYWVYNKYGYKGVDAGANWINVNTGKTGSMSSGLSVPSQDGAKGVLELAHQNGVKLMASLGGWSMSKHFPEVAADAGKRAKFIEDCLTLINVYGFDGIDLDWEFPGPFSGMNFTGTTVDFQNFETLIFELREAIGDDKLITAAFNASPAKLAGFDWTALNETMDYFNMMSYDMNGGWSEHAGHNSPLYSYDNADGNTMSWDETFTYLVANGVAPEKINMGVGFYGRGVKTATIGDLNAATVKVSKNISPDGTVSTAADYDNWESYDGAPNYSFIVDNQEGWTTHWDDIAKVPYLTKENYFLSYDNVASIEEKAKYINTNNIGGVIIWQVFGDLDPGVITETYANKLPYSPTTKAPLVNALNKVFAENSTISFENKAPEITLISPSNNQMISQNVFSQITIEVHITDTDGSLANAIFILNDEVVVFTQDAAEFTFEYTPSSYGTNTLEIIATDNEGAAITKTISFEINEELISSDHPISSLITLEGWDELFPYRIGRDLTGIPIEGEDDYYSYANFIAAVAAMDNIQILFERRCASNAYKVTRINKTTGASIVIREDEDFTTGSSSIISTTQDYGLFVNEGIDATKLRELAAYLANIAQETTGGWDTAPGGRYAWGLRFNEEVGYGGGSLGYRDETNTRYSPVAGKSYHGRGPIQLSWNYNYGQVSEFLYGDKNILLDNPDLVTEDGIVGFQTALWFWMTEQYPKPSAHNVMTGNWSPTEEQENNGLIAGFGATVNIINGGIECNTGTVEFEKVTHRIGHFEIFTDLFSVSTGIDGTDATIELGCANMQAFQIDANECGTQVSIGFETPLNNNTIAISLGDSIPVLLTVLDADSVLSDIAIQVDGNVFNGNQAVWSPSVFGDFTITATANNNAEVLTTSITVTIVDENTISSCELIDEWNTASVYDLAGNKVVYNGLVYENSWWTQNDIPGVADVWKYIENCDGSDDSESDEHEDDDGETTTCDLMAVWNKTTVYELAGNQVLYNGLVYENSWWTQDEIPGETDVWKYIEDCEGTSDEEDTDDGSTTNSCGSIDNWSTETTYDLAGEQVAYNGAVYQNKWWTKSDIPGETDVWEVIEDCTETSNKIGFKDSTVVEAMGSDFKIYPTITSTVFTIESLGKISHLEIFNFKGQLELSSGNAAIINISNLRSGIYLVKIAFENGEYKTARIIKKD